MPTSHTVENPHVTTVTITILMAEICKHEEVFETQIAFVVIILIAMHYKDTLGIERGL